MIVLRITPPTIPASLGGSVVRRVRERFQDEAGTLILDAIRSLLGTNSLYQLSPEYAARKVRRKDLKRIAGKPATQPLILTAALYDNLTVIPSGDGFVVEVQEGEAMAKDGFDYAEFFEEMVDYLGRGLELVEDQLDELLAQIIEEEMLL